MHYGFTSVLILSLLCAMAGASTANAGGMDPAKAAVSSITSNLPTAAADSPTSSPSGVSLSSSADGTSGTVSLGFISNRIQKSDKEYSGQFVSGQISISTPIAKGGKPTEPATLTSIPNATAITFNLSLLSVSALQPGADGLDSGDPCTAMWEGYAKAKDLTEEAARGEIQCGTENIVTYAGVAMANRYNKAMKGAKNARSLWKLGAIGKVGYEDDAYYTPATLLKLDNKGVPWQAGAYWAYISGLENWSVTAEYLHQHSFTQQMSSTACLAGVGPVLKCISGSIGKPAAGDKDVLSLSANWKVNTGVSLAGIGAAIGVAPEFDYDAHTQAYGASLPIYLFGDKTGLTGGVRFDWTSVNHKAIVGVFITKAFNVLSSPTTG